MAQKAVLKLGIQRKASVCELGNQRYAGGGSFTSTKDFYSWAGYTKYVALDLNEKMDAEIYDLNQKRIGFGHFDLVTNNGTGEHIFSQENVFWNAHELCIEGGTMLHILPFSPWVNHGFYNYNPILFRDLAEANNYDIIFRMIGDRWGSDFEIEDKELYREKRPNELERIVAQSENDLFCVFAFKHNGGEFKVPTQGKYA